MRTLAPRPTRAISPTPTPARVRLALFGLTLAFVLLAQPAVARAQEGTTAWVDTGGDCLRLRAAPGLEAGDLDCLDHGTAVELLGVSQQGEHFLWQQVSAGGQVGWVADFYLTLDESEVQPVFEPVSATTAGTPGGLPEPAEGGLTIGLAGHTDPGALVESLPYAVVSVWHLDVPTQQFLRYIPEAPAYVNTLGPGDLAADSVVIIRRDGTLTEVGALPEATGTVAGIPTVMQSPPPGGLTQGLAGITEPRFLAAAQPFPVESIAYFHVGSQTWLTYIPGAPDVANTLRPGQLRVDSVVFLRRADGDAPATTLTSGTPEATPTPEATETPAGSDDRILASITYYYCVPGTNPGGIGGGGGYCGGMANGEQVHEGAAACAQQYMGQRFRIEGDPTGRVYTCSDTGGAVFGEHRDIWFMNSDDGFEWWLAVGPNAYIEVVE